jgi:hypothetical protein
VLVGVTEGWTVAREIAAANVPVIASALADLPESFEQLAATQSNIGRMKAAGVLVGIGTINQDEARQARWEKQYAGNLVALGRIPGASGLDWGEAFATISSQAGRSTGAGRRVRLAEARTARRCGDLGRRSAGDRHRRRSRIHRRRRAADDSRQTRLRDRYWDPKEGALPKAYQH